MTDDERTLMLATAKAVQALVRHIIDDRYPAAALWPRRAEDAGLLDRLEAAMKPFQGAARDVVIHGDSVSA